MKNILNKNLSFNLQAKDFYEFLKESYDEFKVDSLNKKKALICALLSYHLIEWRLWEDESYKDKEVTNKDIDSYITNLKEDLRESFEIIKDLGNGLKHKVLTRKHETDNSSLHKGPFYKTFDSTFDISYLYVEKGEKRYRFINELKNTVNHWDTIYNPTKI